MADINKSYFTGRIGKELELRSTANGTAVCAFSLAVERPKAKNVEKGEIDWLDFVAWRSTAEFICKYLGKGRRVVVEATVRTRKFEDKDGNKRKAVEFTVVDIIPADSRPQNTGNRVSDNYGSQPGGYAQSMSSMNLDSNDDYLPFG